MKRVAIYAHPDQPFDTYLVAALVPCWRALGIDVRIVRDPCDRVEADVGLLHVDLTDVPGPWRGAAQRHPQSINAKLPSVAKRSISTHLVAPGEDTGSRDRQVRPQLRRGA